jgi:hypothetical protein
MIWRTIARRAGTAFRVENTETSCPGNFREALSMSLISMRMIFAAYRNWFAGTLLPGFLAIVGVLSNTLMKRAHLFLVKTEIGEAGVQILLYETSWIRLI